MYWFIAKVVLHVLNKGYKKHNLKSKFSNQVYNQWSSFASISLVSFILPHQKVIDMQLIDTGLKLKESKCDFFKKEIHYLGHLISSEGIHPLLEKLDTICNMPRPKTPKEIKQFLGLCSYYRKFVPRFSDIA